jgi:hypothetical protein
VGRTYLFECPRCCYQAKASGCKERGFLFSVQTIVCLECRSLYDAVIRLKIPETSPATGKFGSGLPKFGLANQSPPPPKTPTFPSVLNRLAFRGVQRFRWVEFKPKCPVSSLHRVEIWTDPDKCPKCGSILEKHPLPYRIWD